MELDINKTWKSVLDGMRLSVSEATFNAYVRKTELLNIKQVEDRLVGDVGCSSVYVKVMLEQRYLGQLSDELTRITGQKSEIKLSIQSGRVEERESGRGLPLFNEPKSINNDSWRNARLRPDFTFDNYAVSGSNQVAYAASMAVARKPGAAYNPLFIYGGVGVGKTHLMQAIGHHLLTSGERGVLFCSGEEFTNDLVEGIRNKSTDKVRSKYRKVKLLLIDDVQFIAGKATVQEEFFHTFNAIQREGGQIVMTSDRPPSEISKLEERLRSRFGAGMIVDVGPADFELRAAIVLIKSKQKGLLLPTEDARLIAERIEGLREIEGFLVRLSSEKDLHGENINPELILKLLRVNKNAEESSKIVTPTEVISAVSGYFNTTPAAIKGEKRNKSVVWPRQILMFILRNELKLPLEEVGRLIGGRDHTTVIHADNKVRAELLTNLRLSSQIQDIKKKLLISG